MTESNKIYSDIENKYLPSQSSTVVTKPKMTRNLQPEVEKIKSVQRSLAAMDFISGGEKMRVRGEVAYLLDMIDNHF